jgi:tetratricopeptide (TPR) repeat protein
MLELAARIRQPSHDWFVTEVRGHHALLEGRLGDAEELMSEARRLGERAQAWSSEVSYRLQLYVLRRLQGRLHEIVDLVRSSADEYPTYPICRCVLAQVTAELALPDAEAQFSALARDGFSALRVDETWLAATSLLAEAAVALRNGEAAAEIHALLLPYEDRVAVSTPEVSTGAVARYLGVLASTLERWDDAERHFLNALEVNERVNARPWLALTQEDYSRMLVARGEHDDAEKAQDLLDQALATYRELGMKGALERARPSVRA